MQLIISLVVFACLALAEMVPGTHVDATAWSAMVWLTISCTAIVPFAAVVQTVFLQSIVMPRRSGPSTLRASIERMIFVHLTIWIACSLAIILVAGWPAVVRKHWGMTRIPLIDDVLILTPVIISLVASWAVFYQFQHALTPTPAYWKSCRRFLALRFRTFFGIALTPVFLYTISADLGLFEDAAGATFDLWEWSRVAVLLAAAVVLFPLVMLVVFPTRALGTNAARRIRNECQRHRMSLTSIRVWSTGRQWANAVVIGFVPGCRVLLITDGLLERFPAPEILAIVRHEAGHVRRAHLPLRLALIIAPLVSLAVMQSIAPSATPVGLLGVIYLGYLVWLVGWLSRKMEYEADLYAAGYFDSPSRDAARLNPDLAETTVAALQRHAASQPEAAKKSSLTHPSLDDRIRFLHASLHHPDVARKFVNRYRRTLGILAIVVGSTLVALPLLGYVLAS